MISESHPFGFDLMNFILVPLDLGRSILLRHGDAWSLYAKMSVDLLALVLIELVDDQLKDLNGVFTVLE